MCIFIFQMLVRMLLHSVLFERFKGCDPQLSELQTNPRKIQQNEIVILSWNSVCICKKRKLYINKVNITLSLWTIITSKWLSLPKEDEYNLFSCSIDMQCSYFYADDDHLYTFLVFCRIRMLLSWPLQTQSQR